MILGARVQLEAIAVRLVWKPEKGIAASKHGQYFELRGGSACPKLKGGDPWHKKYGNEYSWIRSDQNQDQKL